MVANSACTTHENSGLPTWRVILKIGIVAVIRVDEGLTPGREFAFQTGGFSGRLKREKATRNGVYVRFKADRATSKRIRYGFIAVKSTTLIGLNSPRKNTTSPAIRRYIKNFAKRALPLTKLLRKDTPFEWTSETQEGFDDIKKAILNPPVLALPDPNAELQITTDASSRDIGAVLEQKYLNSEVKPSYFFSKKLNPSQSKHNATVLEFFAIYTALNFFRPFLLCRKFKVFTNHKPLAGFLSNKNPSSKILRWKLALEEFNYDIHYIRGSLNSVTDHLSRCINNITIALPEYKDLIKMQHEDPVLSPIIQKVDQNDVSPQVSNYFINGEGLLCRLSKRPSRSPRSNTPRKQICIPHCLKARILESIHSEYGGHLQLFKTYHRLSENFFWQNMYKDTTNFVRSCTRKGVDEGLTPGREFAFQTGGFSGRRKREKTTRNGVYMRFKADRATSKRIRYGFITVKSTTLIGLNSPRKNTTSPAIRFVEPGRTHIPV
ncbi:retrovirus-related Pol polyprotein from transposon 412 [Trichonephila clavipes]|nr:retrovirus-related Pol polyprotein from transposon 412 [Trichonephila clavipes]